jgi:lipopolysaccharide export system permease protein
VIRFRPTILDRYLLAELGGAFGFGLSAFALILAATQILAIGRLVSDQHAPLWAAIEVFLWSLPGIVMLTVPMALLLGTLLAIQRLSGESEITAMKAGGITFLRIVAPLLAAGFLMSFAVLGLQEYVVPFAQDQVTAIENRVINNTSAFGQDTSVTAPLPGGGKQKTFASGYDAAAQALLNVTVLQYDAKNQPTMIAFADRAQFMANKWTLQNVSTYRFEPNGDVTFSPKQPQMDVEMGEKPADIEERVTHGNPQDLSRSTIAGIIRSGQLDDAALRKYTTTYWEKLAQPFACFVFVLIAVPFGLRNMRGGGNTSLGFGLAVAIVFVYYVTATIFSYVGEALLAVSFLMAWMPNLIFTAIGASRLRKAAAV